MIRSIISITIALIFIVSFTSRAACTVNEYCIDFESTNTLSLVAHGGTPSEPNSSKWSQVMDDEYTGINNFDGIDVEFWTSTEDTGATGQYDAPTLLPDFDAQDYDELIDGDAINSGGYHSAPYLVLFDTTASNTKDSDLEVDNEGFTGGNIAIIHEEASSNRECVSDSGEEYCENPDDRYKSGTPHGGFVFVHFSEPVNVHSIDLVDMESGSNQRGSIGFYNDAGNLLPNDDMVAMTYDAGVSEMTDGNWGTQTFSNLYSSLDITTLVIRMQGSGGFDNVAFTKVAEVPEPSSLAIFTIALLGLARIKRHAR